MYEHDLEIITQAVTRIIKAEAKRPLEEINRSKVIEQVIAASMAPFLLNLESTANPIQRLISGSYLIEKVRDTMIERVADAVAR